MLRSGDGAGLDSSEGLKDNGRIYIEPPDLSPYHHREIRVVEGLDTTTVEVVGYSANDFFALKDSRGVYTVNAPKLEVVYLSHLDPLSLKLAPLISCPPETSCDLYMSQTRQRRFYTDIHGIYDESFRIIPGLDPDTTRFTWKEERKSGFLHDQDTVYEMDFVGYGFGLLHYPSSVSSAAISSLEILGEEYRKDQERVYYIDREAGTGSYTPAAVIDGADPATFRVLGSCTASLGGSIAFARDENTLYVRGKPISMDVNSFRYFGTIASGQESSVGLSSDGLHIFRGCDLEPFTDVAQLFIDTVEIVGNYYVKDETIVFDNKGRLMRDVDPEDCTEEQLERCSPSGLLPY